MKKLKLLLSQSLTWTFKKNKIVLKSNDEILLELNEEKAARASFAFDGKGYIIHNEGFWNPKTIIEKEGNIVLTLKRHFLGSRGKIEFENGKTYLCKVRNAPLVKLSFFSDDEKEILNYKLEAKLKPKTVLNIIDYSINENELLMLIILGCFSFSGIVKENDASDLIIIAAGA